MPISRCSHCDRFYWRYRTDHPPRGFCSTDCHDKRGTKAEKIPKPGHILPDSEYLDAMADEAFAPLDQAQYLQYEKITRQQAYRALDSDQAAIVDESEAAVQFRANDATKATAEEWAVLKRIQSLMGEAECQLRTHEATFDHRDIPWGIVVRKGIQVRVQFGPFSFVREYGV